MQVSWDTLYVSWCKSLFTRKKEKVKFDRVCDLVALQHIFVLVISLIIFNKKSSDVNHLGFPSYKHAVYCNQVIFRCKFYHNINYCIDTRVSSEKEKSFREHFAKFRDHFTSFSHFVRILKFA